jgi:RNA polymerase primary sigma factor
MRIMDRLSRILGSRDQASSEPETHSLRPFEIRLIAEGKLEKLAEFAASSRLHAIDPKGDTPLHLAARTGNLAVCDLFIRSGADPGVLNHDRRTPADVAFAEGHGLTAQLLSSLVAGSPETKKRTETDSEREVSLVVDTVVAEPGAVPEYRFAVIQETEPAGGADDLDDMLTFEAEAEPEEFFDQHAGDTASGTFIALGSSSPVVSDDDDGDWDLDLSPAPIAGEGIGSSAAVTADQGAESDFLQVRNRGRQSGKRSIVQTGTRVSIDPDLCVNWAEEILAKGRCSLDDIDRLVADCEGNGDLEELSINVQRNLEAAGFDLGSGLVLAS